MRFLQTIAAWLPRAPEPARPAFDDTNVGIIADPNVIGIYLGGQEAFYETGVGQKYDRRVELVGDQLLGSVVGSYPVHLSVQSRDPATSSTRLMDDLRNYVEGFGYEVRQIAPGAPDDIGVLVRS